MIINKVEYVRSIPLAFDDDKPVKRGDVLKYGIVLNVLKTKIEICTLGIVVINLPYKLKLPPEQPIYANLDARKLDWRKTGKEIGWVLCHKENGHCEIHIDFRVNH
jgi:hypothetical protein